MNAAGVIEQTPAELAREQAAQEREERATRAGADLVVALIEELEAEFPGGQVLASTHRAGSVRMYYGVEPYTGTTPQSERWVGVEVSASVDAWSDDPGLSYMELSPERMTRTGRRVRGGFYCPDVNLSPDGDTCRDGGSITCSSGPALNGGEGPGRMAMFTGCLRIAERVLARCEAGQL